MTGCLQQSHLKLNPTKKEALYLSHGSLGSGIQLPILDGAPLVLAPRVGSLGMILDASLSLEVQISTAARSTFYHLWLIRHLIPYLTSQDLPNWEE